MGILPDGVAGYAGVLPGIGVLNVLEGQGRDASVAADFDASI